jgi:multiple sugar transport system permease protein
VTTVRTLVPRRPGRPRSRETGPVIISLRLLLCAAYAVPLLWILLTSFKSGADVFGGKNPLVFIPTVEAYQEAFTPALFEALRQSLLIAGLATAFVLAIAVPAAYALARISGLVPTIGLGLLIVLQMIPQSATVIPLFQVFSSAGLLDSLWSVVLADTALMTPFAIVLLRPFFRAVPVALEEAASVDGASGFRTFRSIVLPIVRNGAATTGTLVFLIVWGEFLYAINFFVTPGNYPLSALLAQQVSSFGVNWPGLMALGIITSIPILVLFLFSYRLLREGLTVGAVK